jgi:hypothetical protein
MCCNDEYPITWRRSGSADRASFLIFLKEIWHSRYGRGSESALCVGFGSGLGLWECWTGWILERCRTFDGRIQVIGLVYCILKR